MIKKHARSLSPPTIPRLAGGYVRDLLLGIDSSDVDVALDNISGYDFAVSLSRKSQKASRPHKIQANPDKSKHLETAVLTINGMSIDFVHLRSETYADTRIPEILPGTPEEDALRRDITINALFYNLETEEIEDFTRRGIKDLHDRIIDTPLPPLDTLFDDPLRILRIFRFHAKLGFTISPRIYEALNDPRIRTALLSKVSSERVGIEINKMLSYPNGHLGIVEIIKARYVGAIFKMDEPAYLGSRVSSLPGNAGLSLNCSVSICFWDTFRAIFGIFSTAVSPGDFDIGHVVPNIGGWISSHGVEPERKDIELRHVSILQLYAILHNFSGIKHSEKRCDEYLNVHLIRNALKSTRETSSQVLKLERGIGLVFKLLHNGSKSKLIDFVLVTKDMWIFSMLIAAIIGDSSDILDLTSRIIRYGYYDCYERKPVITGGDMKGRVEGKEMSESIHWCNIYQIEHSSTSKEEILDAFTKNYSLGSVHRE